jgi:hypothetical protein
VSLAGFLASLAVLARLTLRRVRAG